VATPAPHHGTRRTISIVDDVNLLSPQTRTSLPLPLGPLTTSDVGGLEGEAESSCGHPREAMKLILARRISRRNRTASKEEEEEEDSDRDRERDRTTLVEDRDTSFRACGALEQEEGSFIKS
jgi:hypothetical protein